MPKISIIIPIYNAQITLERCLDSIGSQTFSDFDVLLINDGSTDKSIEISERYCRMDSRFKLYSQNNAGPSAARNKGLDLADGDYLYFVDSDDHLAEDALEKLYTAAVDSAADMTICGFCRVKGSGEIIHEFPYSPGIYEGEACRKIALDLLENTSSVYLPPYSCIRMIRRELIEELQLRYAEDIKRSEDYLFTTELHFRINKLCLITDQPLYYYVDSKSSITNNYLGNYWKMAKAINERLIERLPESDIITSRLNVLLVFRSLMAYNNSAKAKNKEIFDNEMAEILGDKDLFQAVDSLSFKAGINQFKAYYLILRLRLKAVIKLRYYLKYLKNKNSHETS